MICLEFGKTYFKSEDILRLWLEDNFDSVRVSKLSLTTSGFHIKRQAFADVLVEK